MENKDKETLEILSAGEKAKLFTESGDWKDLKGRFARRIQKMMSIESEELLHADKETIIQVITAKKLAKDMIIDVIREVEGIADQHKGNAQIKKEVTLDEYLITL